MKTDFLGKELNVGDEVVLVRPNYREFCVGTISKFTQCYVFVDIPGKFQSEVIKQSPHQLIRKRKMTYYKQLVSETDLELIVNSCHKNFKPTGSRFMNSKFGNIIPIQETTDYDFVTFDGDPKLTTWPYAIDALVNRSASKPSLYKDKNTVDVFDYKCGNTSIDVIVKTVDSFKPYCVLFNTMDAEFYKNYIWKSSDVWDANISNESRKDIIRSRINILIDYLKVQLK